MGLFLLLLFLVLVGLFVWLIVALVRRSGHAKAPAITPVASTLPGGQDALEVLRLRYARGEITREEYLATRDDLSK